MAKFCTKCGRPLEEGEVCNCQSKQENMAVFDFQPEQNTMQSQLKDNTKGNSSQQADYNQQMYGGQQAYNQQSQQSPQPSQVGIFIQRVFSNLLLLLKEPVTMGREFVKSADVKMAAAFIVIQGILAGLFGMAVEGKLASLIGSTLQGMLGGYSSLFGITSVELPYAKIFFGTLVMSIILSVILAGVLLAANIIFKNQVTFQEMLCETAMRSICIMPVAVVALILILLNPAMGIVVFFSANIWAIVVVAQVNPVRNEGATNLMPLALFLALFVFLLISCYLMYKTSGMYIPEELGGSFSDMLEEIM